MKITVLLSINLLTVFNLCAQKLPDKQKMGMRITTDIKIDGKSDELGSQFSAYNSATELFYTIANNDKVLYLALHAENPDVINRIVSGGLTFTVINKESKNDKGLSVTYPVKSDPSIVMFALKPGKGRTPDTSAKAAEATMKSNNQKLEHLFRLIKISGAKNLDTLSIYNEEGIEAAQRFDIKKQFTIELSIPLSLLSDRINKANTFTYEIRLNGGKVGRITTEPFDASLQAAFDKVAARAGASTNFTSEYILMK